MTVWDVVRICLTSAFGIVNVVAFSDWRFSKVRTIGIAIVWGVLTAVCVCLLTAYAKEFMRTGWLLLLILQLGVIVGGAFLLGKHNGFRTLYTAAIALLFNQIGAVFTLGFAMIVSQEWLLYLLYAVVYAGLNFIVIFFFRKTVVRLMSVRSANWAALFFLAVFLLITLIVIVPLPSQNSDPFNITAGVLISLSIIWIFAFMRRELADYERRRLADEGRHAIESEVVKLEAQINTMEANEKKLAIFRHDLKHHFRMLSELLASNDLLGCQDILSALDQSIGDSERGANRTRFCKNKFLNSVLSYYAEAFERENIVFRTDISIPESDQILYRELAVVVGNCLDNALHACIAVRSADSGSSPEVLIKYYPAGGQMFLEIVNPYVGEVKFDESGLPVTKELGHGIGSKSVKSFVERYSGIVSYAAEAGVFTVRIII